ncbi:hypothetical protein HFO58_11035 [Rhizobium leguminosarum]|uniref:hypothetical protein n=1 Tax=Rhizobium leguminosarum TaxID=384 RepID=UPI001C947317|nr:hypothetical protein [Rhizobium leguminosarum]MBY5533691.1 hypothetical protein [Rhizobium leguminosarum]
MTDTTDLRRDKLKSPWGLLSKLRPKWQQQEAAPGDQLPSADDIPDATEVLGHGLKLTDHEVPVVGGDDTVGKASVLGQVTSQQSPDDAAKVEVAVQMPEAPMLVVSENQQRTAPKKGRSQRKRVIAPLALSAPESSPFLDEVALDDDIKKLRLLLADKLREQNLQLRTMIARFDRPRS